MAFDERFLEELKARASLAEVVGRRVKLTRRGREHIGLCPFHSEKTPSFTVSDAKGFYHCFGCQAHGSAFDFVMRTEGLSFPEAVEKLAHEVGLEVPRQSPEAQAADARRAGLYELMEAAAGWFASQLAGQSAARAREYLAKRGLDQATIQRFRLGYAPDHRGMLREAMRARGFSDEQQQAAGLLGLPEGGGEPYSWFRDRIMFPIADRRGRTIAFGARAMGEAKPKYLNSPETPLFHKGRALYNLAAARAAAHEAGTVIAAEGYMDVIALCRAGLGHAVAPLGTALTEEQMAELWRMAPEPILCFDGDEAGRRAAGRAAERALPLLRPGYSLRFVELPPGEDPDSLFLSRGGAGLRQLFEAATPLVDLLWRRSLEGRALDTPERRASYRKDLGELVRSIRDGSVREYYAREFGARLRNLFPEPGRAARNAARPRALATPRGLVASAARLNAGLANARAREQEILSLVMRFPALADDVLEELNSLNFQAPDLDRLRRAILEVVASGDGLDLERLRHDFSGGGLSNLIEQLTGPKGPGFRALRPDVTLEQARAVLAEAMANHRLAALEEEMREVEAAYREDVSDANHARLLALRSEVEQARDAVRRHAGDDMMRM